MEPTLTVSDSLKPVLDELKRLEPLFHSAHPEASIQQFEQLVAPDFWEVGASGKRYGREFVFKVLAERAGSPEPASYQECDFHVAEIGAEHYLLTYTLTQPCRVTRRASIWHRTPKGWQVVYHQGTVVQGG